jgi:hypothetical protein
VNISKGPTDKFAIFGVKCSALGKIDPTADNVSSYLYIYYWSDPQNDLRERTAKHWSIRSAIALRSKGVTVITVVAPRKMIPARKAVESDVGGRKAT